MKKKEKLKINIESNSDQLFVLENIYSPKFTNIDNGNYGGSSKWNVDRTEHPKVGQTGFDLCYYTSPLGKDTFIDDTSKHRDFYNVPQDK